MGSTLSGSSAQSLFSMVIYYYFLFFFSFCKSFVEIVFFWFAFMDYFHVLSGAVIDFQTLMVFQQGHQVAIETSLNWDRCNGR